MFMNFLQRLLSGRNPFESRPPPPLSTRGRNLLLAFNRLAEERNRLDEELSHALDTIHTQNMLLAEYEELVHRAMSGRSDDTDLSFEATMVEPQSSPVCPHFYLGWIETTWLCSTHNSELLGDAEAAWIDGEPRWALVMASGTICNEELTFLDRVTTCSFIAALLHYLGKHEESNQLLDDILLTIHRNHTYSQAVKGVVSFIRGKNLMARGRWNEAYWAFAGALYTPGYHTKAQQFQRDAIRNSALENTNIVIAQT